MKKTSSPRPLSLVLFIALASSIPAFYLVLTGPTMIYRSVGSVLYVVTAILMAVEIAKNSKRRRHSSPERNALILDFGIFLGALASAWPTGSTWPLIEWVFRLGFCSVVFIRLSTLLAKMLAPHHLFHVIGIAIAMLAIAGGGFYWLEPQVLTYADGLWLAFITGATVGYGDVVPSTPASRIFAIFIVLLGYALFSVVTASIAALFVSKDEKNFEKELHADIRSLRGEIVALRETLHHKQTNRIT
jgi:voltage-gated potassium channel